MKITEIIYDIKTLLAALTDDTRVKDSYLYYKIRVYRGYFLEQQLKQETIIPDEYFQRVAALNVYPVSSSDDPNVPDSSIHFGKVRIPRIIGYTSAYMRVYEAARHKRIYHANWDYLMEMIESKDPRLEVFRYFIPAGPEDLYIYRYIAQIAFSGVLDNPLDGYTFNTTQEDLDSLVAGVIYKVISGSVLATDIVGGTTLTRKDETFIADANTTYSGDGKVVRTSMTSSFTEEDDFPISYEMVVSIVLQILTKDYMLEKQNVFDIFNDSIDQMKVLKKGP